MPTHTSINPSLLFVAVFNTCLLAACSSSETDSNSVNTADSQDSVFTDQDTAGTTVSTDLLDDAATPVVVNPNPESIESSPNPAPDPVGASQSDADSDTDITIAEESVASPVDPDIARVQFNMTVPAYMSDALQVEIDWSSGSERAQWVVDEDWTATIDFPSNNGLYYYFNVRFLGNNGLTILGSYDMQFSYEDNAGTTSVIVIDADDFDTIRWDNDQDGATNLNELRAGTDPDVSSQVYPLPVLTTIVHPDNFAGTSSRSKLAEFSAGYEDVLSDERPYFFHEHEPLEEGSIYGTTRTVTVEIDAFGNAAYEFEDIWYDPNTTQTRRKVGLRVNTGSSIQWSGTSYYLGSGAYRGHEYEFSNETRIIDAGVLGQQGTVVGGPIGYAVGGLSLTYDIQGPLLPNTGYCQPTAGTLAFNDRYDTDPYDVEGARLPVNYLFEVSKRVADEFWNVLVFDSDNGLIDNYLVQRLDFQFRCDFQDM